jgi:site-specific recombinase XerD
MTDKRTLFSMDWIEERLQQIQWTTKALDQAVLDYLRWMASVGYKRRTRQRYHHQLDQFVRFVKSKRLVWDEVFTFHALNLYQQARSIKHPQAVRGLSRYLFLHKKIKHPIAKPCQPLPDVYEQYLVYYKKSRQASFCKVKQVRRVLVSFDRFLQNSDIELSTLNIEHIDAFLADFNTRFLPQTCRLYRSYLRGFLKYLYLERSILSKDLAPLVVGAPMFAKAKPPQFFRSREVQDIFAGLTLSSPKEIRTCAMVNLAYTLGLRPKEISRISLDEISFAKAELTLKIRKNDNPIRLPLPDMTIKAIAAYLIGARPESKHRRLFLSLQPPYGPISEGTVGYYISQCVKAINPASTPYWLRHTYAQNLLEAGVSIYEIKEMMGHDSIESTRQYLHIHMKLMRKVLFDEEL